MARGGGFLNSLLRHWGCLPARSSPPISAPSPSREPNRTPMTAGTAVSHTPCLSLLQLQPSLTSAGHRHGPPPTLTTRYCGTPQPRPTPTPPSRLADSTLTTVPRSEVRHCLNIASLVSPTPSRHSSGSQSVGSQSAHVGSNTPPLSTHGSHGSHSFWGYSLRCSSGQHSAPPLPLHSPR